MRVTRVSLVAFAVLVSVLPVSAQDEATTFSFSMSPGEQYRIVSEVLQQVFIDGELSHESVRLNRIRVQIGEVLGESPRRGFHSLEYQSSVETEKLGQVYESGRTYTAEFWRDSQGYFDIGNEYFVPNVQNVPVFPNHPIKSGDRWTADGIEVHDLRQGFDIDEPFRFSMPVNYTYVGKSDWNGRSYDLLLIDYVVYYPTQLPRRPELPRLVTGASSQRMYWDTERGRPVYYEEDYELSLLLYSGNLFTFAGTASARVVDSEPLDRQATREQLEEELAERNLDDVGIRESEEGISLVIEDIQFLPDSATLQASERRKLDDIALILQRFPDRDILVTGHTALAGTASGRQQLSEERAQAVGQYLLDIGARDRTELMFRGVGAEDPVAENSTEEGRRRNRRVEILILDN